jgi:hypothetical protein
MVVVHVNSSDPSAQSKTPSQFLYSGKHLPSVTHVNCSMDKHLTLVAGLVTTTGSSGVLLGVTVDVVVVVVVVVMVEGN